MAGPYCKFSHKYDYRKDVPVLNKNVLLLIKKPTFRWVSCQSEPESQAAGWPASPARWRIDSPAPEQRAKTTFISRVTRHCAYSCLGHTGYWSVEMMWSSRENMAASGWKCGRKVHSHTVSVSDPYWSWIRIKQPHEYGFVFGFRRLNKDLNLNTKFTSLSF